MSAVDDEEEERRRWALVKGWWLAMSGSFANWEAVETQLVAAGIPGIEDVLSDPGIRRRMDEVCGRARDADAGRAHLVDADPDAAAIWRVIDDEHEAMWNRDFDAYERAHSGAEFERWWAWIRLGGMVMHDGWQRIGARIHVDMQQDPDRNPYFAYGCRRERVQLRISGTMAWTTFDLVYPTADLMGFHGPERTHEVRVLENIDGTWKIVLTTIIDEQHGQTDVPTWEVDLTGRVLTQNHAAEVLLAGDNEVLLRGGRLRMHDRATDARLRELIAWCAGRVSGGVMSAATSRSLVYDAGTNMPARVWWVRAQSERVFVSFNDPQLAEEQLVAAAKAFGLSPSKQRLAAFVVEGLVLTEAARRAGVRISTARTQLQRIFDKLGVRTQPALVRMLLTTGDPT